MMTVKNPCLSLLTKVPAGFQIRGKFKLKQIGLRKRRAVTGIWCSCTLLEMGSRLHWGFSDFILSVNFDFILVAFQQSVLFIFFDLQFRA